MRNLALVFVLMLPLATFAQETDVPAQPDKLPYNPGKWYTGVHMSVYWFSYHIPELNSIPVEPIPSSLGGGGFNVWAGHRLTRHIDVRAGLFFHSDRYSFFNSKPVQLNDTTWASRRGSTGNRPFYLPLEIRLTPFGSHRRIQPYFLLGINTQISRVYEIRSLYDPARMEPLPGQPDFRRIVTYSSETERKGFLATFGAYVGLGLQVRVYRRLGLSLDGTFGRNISRNSSLTASGNFGLTYDLAGK
ncbi:MAG: hypothetical protein MUD08_15815 [Cytophagales bacterium]|nr:hypothetical protein [Cytophagales bacterium]